MQQNEHVIVICGPTASGKSALAIKLAQYFNNNTAYSFEGAEIVSADSMQIYKNLNIGTAKVTAEDKMMVKHHMIDICEPDQFYSVAQYKKDATSVIMDIQKRNKIAIVCGGTGQYLSALIEGIEYIDTPVNLELRAELNQRADTQGIDHLYAELKKYDPAAAAKLSVSDRKRIIRAHEIIAATGKTPTEINRLSRLKGPDFTYKSYCLAPDRDILYQRINSRTVKMIDQGWIDETKQVLSSGIPLTATSMQAIGYRQIISYLQGKSDKDETIGAIQQATRRYAKRQLTWFRKMPQLYWLHTNDQHQAYDEIMKDLNNFLR